jgi:hypothetical protein
MSGTRTLRMFLGDVPMIWLHSSAQCLVLGGPGGSHVPITGADKRDNLLTGLTQRMMEQRFARAKQTTTGSLALCLTELVPR